MRRLLAARLFWPSEAQSASFAKDAQPPDAGQIRRAGGEIPVFTLPLKFSAPGLSRLQQLRLGRGKRVQTRASLSYRLHSTGSQHPDAGCTIGLAAVRPAAAARPARRDTWNSSRNAHRLGTARPFRAASRGCQAVLGRRRAPAHLGVLDAFTSDVTQEPA